eukprot:TRINITY_DN5241_c0_g1_i1.p1 TRINITY_DN5241_c0_g1~~TRINITY_DN5241_c0_g1_i1.p1  ORF type:complete len:329 (-),score=91.82 TRINITY_DN5241_c0_g1_i1:7-993(-)
MEKVGEEKPIDKMEEDKIDKDNKVQEMTEVPKESPSQQDDMNGKKRVPRRKSHGDDASMIPEPIVPKKGTELTKEELKKPVFIGIDAFSIYWLLEKACVKWGNQIAISFNAVNAMIHNGMRKNNFGIRWVKKCIRALQDELKEESPLCFCDEPGMPVTVEEGDAMPSCFMVTEAGKALADKLWPGREMQLDDEKKTPKRRKYTTFELANLPALQLGTEEVAPGGVNPLWAEIARMNAFLTSVTNERDQLKIAVSNLTREKQVLQDEIVNSNKEKEILTLENAQLKLQLVSYPRDSIVAGNDPQSAPIAIVDPLTSQGSATFVPQIPLY